MLRCVQGDPSFTSLQINGVTCAMFATAVAANPIIQSTASDQGVEPSWAKWAVAAPRRSPPVPVHFGSGYTTMGE